MLEKYYKHALGMLYDLSKQIVVHMNINIKLRTKVCINFLSLKCFELSIIDTKYVLYQIREIISVWLYSYICHNFICCFMLVIRMILLIDLKIVKYT